jgi:hypothetical protein
LRAGLVIEGYAAQLRQSPGQERSAFQIGTIDRPRGAGAGIAVRRTETEHDHGERQWERHSTPKICNPEHSGAFVFCPDVN